MNLILKNPLGSITFAGMDDGVSLMEMVIDRNNNGIVLEAKLENVLSMEVNSTFDLYENGNLIAKGQVIKIIE